MCSDDSEGVGAASELDIGEPSANASPALLDELVAANHILFDQGVVDAFGHVSVRHDKRPDRFFLARNMAPGRVTLDDLVEFTLDGEPVSANGRKVYLERFIHSEIFKARPDVQAVVHSHSHSIVPLSVVSGARLRPVFHMAGFIGSGAPVFEIREVAGDATDLLISNSEIGAALAQHFTQSDIVLMRGHGSTVVGDSIKRAVYRAVYAELNARYQLQALQLGDVTFLTEGECRACVDRVEGQMQRPWELWLDKARIRCEAVPN
ncbi:class II aldolase/adducin family protein [Bosea sp. 47.2.35]|jgi:ribulose-5-phosphate 4-epimerase/fuculose-1-phosphate aldolase|uniref:class II aldolase/adducin family protein n=1 Tax=Bosea sp. 47.2.35 TaxID=2969304 RepID=UPI0021502E9B|nr:class II aldolase/adducin family protein [Bosea sp. 47.2.35]MCR4524172.1 class II aldolase/adducin family protein [Bosea sp. 47.2.35]